MIIDLEPIFSGLKDSISIDQNINIPDYLLEKSSIKKLKSTKFIGKIKRLADLPITLEGKLSGIMTLLDDIDLSEVDYEFKTEVEELIIDNKLDLLSLLWQLIQVEIPSKVHNKNYKNNNLSGEGWKLITEEELNENNAFSNLDKMLQERSQK